MAKFGNRKDGKLIRDIDSLHFYTGLLYPNRADNQVFISVKINLNNINKYLEKKNKDAGNDKLKLFHVIVCALLKTIILRPQLNRFIVNGKYYQRNEVSSAFIVKKKFDDKSEEGLAYIVADENENIDDIKEQIYSQINSVRSSDSEAIQDTANSLAKIPRWLVRPILKISRFLDRHGKLPVKFLKGDPYCSSILVTNLGSIGLDHVFHHLTNWGTTSLLCSIGKKQIINNVEDSLELGFTIDERITDGYYCAKSIKLLKFILNNPDVLNYKFCEEVRYE